MNQDEHGNYHRHLSEYYYLLAAHTQQVATYHAVKAANENTDLEMPRKSPRLVALEEALQTQPKKTSREA